MPIVGHPVFATTRSTTPGKSWPRPNSTSPKSGVASTAPSTARRSAKRFPSTFLTTAASSTQTSASTSIKAAQIASLGTESVTFPCCRGKIKEQAEVGKEVFANSDKFKITSANQPVFYFTR